MEPSAESFAALERELALRTAELDACKAELAARNADWESARIAQVYQDASNEVLRIISDSPGDVQRVLDAIVERAVKLSGASRGTVCRFDGEMLHLAAVFGRSAEELADERTLSLFPMRPGSSSVHARAVLARAPNQCADVQTDPDYAAEGRVVAENQGFRSALAVPMLRDGQVIGSIGVSRSEPGLFPDQLVNLLQTFAEQAVVAIENARLIDETREALEHQTATSEILKVISSSPTDVQPVFEKILDSCQVLFGAEQMALMRVDGDELVHVSAHRGAEMEIGVQPFPKPIEDTVTGLVIRKRSAVHIANVAESGDELPPTWKTVYDKIGNHSAVVAPLLRGAEGIGSIVLMRFPPKPFSDKEIALLTTFADQAVIAIENVRLFNETQEALEQQTATAEILRVISSSPTDVQPVMEAIAERAATLCNARLGAVTSFDGNLVHMKAVYGASSEEEAAIWAIHPVEPGRTTYCARAIQERRTINVADLRDDPEHTFGGDQRVITERSALTVPMLRDGQPIGAISVSREIPGVYPESLVTLLQTFAEQAVIAIENVRLFNETQEALERQTAMSDVLRVISESPTDVQPVFDAIVERAMALCGAARGAATRFDGEMLHLACLKGVSEEDMDATRAVYPLPPGRSTLNARAVLERTPVQIPDFRNDPEYSIQLSSEAGSGLAVPLIRDGRVVGTLSVFRRDTGLFADKFVRLLQAFADQAVIALENVRLFNETQEALERQTATAEILQVISNSPTDVQPVFEAIAQRAKSICGARFAITTQLNGELVELMAMSEMPAGDIENMRSAFPMSLDTAAVNCRAIAAKTPVQIADITTDPEYLQQFSENLMNVSSRARLAVPMIRDGKAFGSIGVARDEPGEFPDKLVKLLQTFAAQAVIAVENVRLFNETKEALERQTAMSEVLRVISESPTDVQPVFDAIVERAMALCGATKGSGTRFDGEQLHMMSFQGVSDKDAGNAFDMFPSPPGTGTLNGRAVLRCGPAQITDWDSDPDIVTEWRGISSGLAVPLLREGRAVGSLAVFREESGPFPDQQVKLLQTFADQAVIATENVRLFNETQDALERQTATADILKVISSSPTDVQPVYEKILDSCKALFGVADMSIGLIHEDGRIYDAASRGELMEAVLKVGRSTPLEGSATAHVIGEREIFHLPELGRDTDPPWPFVRVLFDTVGPCSLLMAPLLHRDQGIGSISLLRQPPKAFSDKEIALLGTFADQAIIAIENVRLFNETKESLDQQTAISDILRVTTESPTDVQPVLDAIGDHASGLCDAASASVYLIESDHLRHVTSRGPLAEQTLSVDLIPIDRTSTMGRAIIERRTVNIEDMRAEAEEFPRSYEIAQRLDYRSIVAAPLFREGKPFGAILLLRQDVRPFSDREAGLLRTFGDQAAIALENVRLFHEIEGKSRELEAANEHKSEFLANMSHELRTPLNAIIGFSEVMLERMFGELNEKQDDYLKDIHSSGEHLLSLINDILDLSKIEAGRMELEVDEFDIAGALDNTLTLIRERAQQHGIALRLEADEGLGAICADQRKFKQIMLNLLSNAVKFTPDGGQIEVRAAFKDNELAVAVRDTGIGIAPEDQDAVFQEFQQAGGRFHNKQEGTGLGLSLTKRFVELHGGTIGLVSTPGEGSTFSFTLPRQAAGASPL